MNNTAKPKRKYARRDPVPEKVIKSEVLTPEVVSPVAIPEPGQDEGKASPPEIVVKTVLEVAGYTRGREAGRQEGFAEGVRYIVTLAEENMAKALEIHGREALVNSGKLPGWWIITLVKALKIDDLPSDLIVREVVVGDGKEI